jgi:LmbE family N-acetylglucosaminyl deacetylase
MRYLYIFPHPDDECFGPAPGISRQKRQGHEVFLLTLTKGGATRVRHHYGYSIEEMGEVRQQEMQAVAATLGLDGLAVLDLPDSGLKELDPRQIERLCAEHIQRLQPDILVSYPVHGISGFHDHLVMHAVAKRVFVGLQERGASYLRRLAFFTLSQALAQGNEGIHNLHYSTEQEIDCVMPTDEEDRAQMQAALGCYATYQQVIQASRVMETVGNKVHYEIFGEEFAPPLTDLAQGL